MIKILLFTILLYILVLFQASFLIYFDIKGFILNLIFVLIILLNLFERKENYSGLWTAAIGGFFLDIFSENFIGFYALILLMVAIFIKYILKQYVRIPFSKRS